MGEKEDIRIFASSLKVIRTAFGLKQEELAKRLGVSRSTISNIENGSMELTKPMFLAMLALFTSGAALSAIPLANMVLAGIGIKKLVAKYLVLTKTDDANANYEEEN